MSAAGRRGRRWAAGLSAAVATGVVLAGCSTPAPEDSPDKPDAAVGIVDTSGVLDDGQKKAISESIGNDPSNPERPQINVFLESKVPDGVKPEDRALKVAGDWGVDGQNGNWNGVILYVAKDAGVVRIVVSNRLSKKLTPDEANQITSKDMRPMLEEGDIPGGVDAGVREIRAQIGATGGGI